MLIVPLLTRQRSVVGVLQLINAKDDRGAVVPFSNAHRLVTSQFAHYAADAIDRARQSRESVLRLVELASLRDPYETGRHAKRVGAYATELYDSWARRNQVTEIEIDQNREIIRTAAMLHDVGKVAVQDAVLRKPGRLSDAERREMRLHTIHGARLFRRIDSPWDEMAREVALNHHECWDGTGYPGRIDNIFDRTVRIGRPKRGPEIPLSARVVSIVDVYDALMSKRAYKDAWTEADVLGYLENQAGRQFDPELVTTFLSMQGIVRAIRTKFSF
jgi:putative nucleotidyltransferase with HDIG domain